MAVINEKSNFTNWFSNICWASVQTLWFLNWVIFLTACRTTQKKKFSFYFLNNFIRQLQYSIVAKKIQAGPCKWFKQENRLPAYSKQAVQKPKVYRFFPNVFIFISCMFVSVLLWVLIVISGWIVSLIMVHVCDNNELVDMLLLCIECRQSVSLLARTCTSGYWGEYVVITRWGVSPF